MTNGKAEYLKNWHKKRMNADPIEYKLDTMLRGAKNRARTKRLRFNLHIDYVRTIAKEYCPYFPEIKLAYKTDKRKGWKSIDKSPKESFKVYSWCLYLCFGERVCPAKSCSFYEV